MNESNIATPDGSRPPRHRKVPVAGLSVEARLLEDDGAIPNNAELPLLVYRQAVALPEDDPASVFESLFTANGWPAAWRNGVHPFHHYHSTAHEALGVFSGRATACFGGEQGIRMSVSAGDVVIIPAGVGHKGIEATSDLGIVGAYPAGTAPDLCRGLAGERPACLKAIIRVPLPRSDPLYGAEGPLREHWTSTR